MRKLIIDKYTLRFNCPSEDGLKDRGCRNTATMEESVCRGCWLEAIVAGTKGKTRNKIDKELTQLANGELKELELIIEEA